MHDERIAVYAGSFDPPTHGHIHILEQATAVFDAVHVLIATNADKKKTPLLTPEERLSVFQWFDDFWSKGAGMSGVRGPVIYTATLPASEYTVRYAHEVGARFLVRGLRDGIDFEYERKLQFANARIAHRFGIKPPTTWYIGSPLNDDLYTSSTLVRGFMDMNDWQTVVGEFVPGPVMSILEARYGHADRP